MKEAKYKVLCKAFNHSPLPVKHKQRKEHEDNLLKMVRAEAFKEEFSDLLKKYNAEIKLEEEDRFYFVMNLYVEGLYVTGFYSEQITSEILKQV